MLFVSGEMLLAYEQVGASDSIMRGFGAGGTGGGVGGDDDTAGAGFGFGCCGRGLVPRLAGSGVLHRHLRW